MSEQPVESGQEVKGTESLPSPTFQEPSGDQPTSAGQDLGVLVEQLEERLGKRIEETVTRTVQSTKDRRWTEVEKMYGSLSEIRQALDTVNADEPTRDRVLLDVLTSRAAAKATSTQSSGAGNSNEEAKRKGLDILINAGVDLNDPGVTELLSGRYRNGEEYLISIANYLAKRTASAIRPPNPAAVVPAGGGAVPAGDKERLMAQYNEEKKRVPRGSDRMVKLRMKYRDLAIQQGITDFDV